MKRVKLILPVLFFLIAISARAEEAKPVVSAEEIIFCTSVEERQPVGANSQFFSSVERIFCFTRIKGAPAETKIYHCLLYTSPSPRDRS